ncbi:MAG: SRPBCC family protein [Planctomycetota bacterium]
MKFTFEKSIAAPPAVVFEHATDIPSWPDQISGIVSTEVLTEGPIGVGTRFRETRIIFKREATEEMEFVSFDPPEGYAVEAMSCGTHYHTQIRFLPEGEGTRLVWEFTSKPMTFMGKVMSVVFRPMAKSMTKLLEQDLEDMKQSVEASVAAG